MGARTLPEKGRTAVVEPVPGEVVTFLEMTSPEQLRAGRVADGLTLSATNDEALVRATIVRVGAPYRWPSAGWGDPAWAEWFADPRHQSFLLRSGDDVAGIVETTAHPPYEVEIISFGLVPEYVGAGIGGHALTLAARLAWNLKHPALDEVRRVWLHTSTLDHPNALRNYVNRGFHPYRTQTRGHVAPG
ncbi:GNAT family N-acetyltransferase [Frankia sp. CNm7]|uniref:GNAT family N-acetyltransferase n=2 Tax=Frankia nepalensis TaxID=1836974 RepID=A0A937RM14_9ACTN|nr:GNAT family N-acetyltransferase [Frankia nepalensis]MBL7514350.1 GNAT family N-acetyltransferase [Frankia nepalensis]MBL7517893.1 GNAT family N-acetyltransferase [Frankia nepalensis]MBL7631375.1 GNAT family N-acetyltransferase [Frankia nepalensis]